MTYRVVLWDMPSKVKALTSVNDDGSHTVMINSRLSKEQQMRCFLHEFEHIKMNHFNCFRSVDEIEKKPRRY